MREVAYLILIFTKVCPHSLITVGASCPHCPTVAPPLSQTKALSQTILNHNSSAT